jgi:hypothetical protein
MRNSNSAMRVMGVIAMRGFRYFLFISIIFSNLLAKNFFSQAIIDFILLINILIPLPALLI